MIPPLVALVGVFDPSGFWQTLATVFGTAAVWAQRRAVPERDAVAELTERLRRPVRFVAAHPIISVRRAAERRRRAS